MNRRSLRGEPGLRSVTVVQGTSKLPAQFLPSGCQQRAYSVVSSLMPVLGLWTLPVLGGSWDQDMWPARRYAGPAPGCPITVERCTGDARPGRNTPGLDEWKMHRTSADVLELRQLCEAQRAGTFCCWMWRLDFRCEHPMHLSQGVRVATPSSSLWSQLQPLGHPRRSALGAEGLSQTHLHDGTLAHVERHVIPGCLVTNAVH